MITNTVVDNALSVINTFFVVTKQYVYRCRCQKTKPSILALKREFLFIFHVESINAKMNGTYKMF